MSNSEMSEFFVFYARQDTEHFVEKCRYRHHRDVFECGVCLLLSGKDDGNAASPSRSGKKGSMCNHCFFGGVSRIKRPISIGMKIADGCI